MFCLWLMENHSDQPTSDNHNFCYRQTTKEIKTGLEPSFNLIAKPVICQISSRGGFSQITSHMIFSLLPS